MLQELIDRDAYIADDLAEKERRDIPPSVNWHRRAASIRVPKLLMGAPLPDLFEAEPVQDPDDLARTQDRKPAHCSGRDCLSTDELRLESWLAVLEEHRNDFVEIGVELVEGFALRVGSRKAGNIADEKSRLPVALDNGCIRFHGLRGF